MHPRRLLFIASIGNPKPYRRTRHSAGHLLLDALTPLLRARLAEPAPFYTTWYSPSYMNESGPKLVRQLKRWLGERDEVLQRRGMDTPTTTTSTSLTGYPATLVILHDELEAQPGKLRIKRGGPETASLRGHRGLISCFESLRGARLYPSRRGAKERDLSVLRVGLGIGRPSTRGKDTVADYVLTEMEASELVAVQRAADPVLRAIEEEFSWEDTGGSSKV